MGEPYIDVFGRISFDKRGDLMLVYKRLELL